MTDAVKTNSVVSMLGSPRSIRWAIYILGLVPAAWVFYAGFTDHLGADPVRALERTLGLWSLRFIVTGLCVTPLRRLGGPSLIAYRRALGLVAFYYAALHLSAYLWFDQGFDFAAIWKDILKRPYITVGMAAFVVLVPLVATSNNFMIRRLGKTWTRLHRWVYVAAALGAVHFIMVLKTWQAEPLMYAALVAVLLGFRLFVSLKKRVARGGNTAMRKQQGAAAEL